MSELQARQARPLSKYRQPGQGHPRLGPQGSLPRPLHRLQSAGVQDHTVDPPVPHQQIGAVAHYQAGPALLPAECQQGRKLPGGDWTDHAPGGPAHPEGGVPVHRLLPQYLQGWELLSADSVKTVAPRHRACSPSNFWSYHCRPSSAAPMIPASLPRRALLIVVWRSASRPKHICRTISCTG